MSLHRRTSAPIAAYRRDIGNKAVLAALYKIHYTAYRYVPPQYIPGLYTNLLIYMYVYVLFYMFMLYELMGNNSFIPSVMKFSALLGSEAGKRVT